MREESRGIEMQNKNGLVSMAIIGLIIVTFSIAAFFLLDIERIALNRWALAFLLLSEIVLFGGLIRLRCTDANHSSVFLKAGVASALALYFIATLICSLFAGAFKESLNVFILIQLAIIMVFLIVTISVSAYSRGIERRNQEDIKKVGTGEPKRGGF
jgi:hypothetical protein